MTDTVWLKTVRHESCTAAEAAGLLAGEGTIGFLYSPAAARFVARRDGRWTVRSETEQVETADFDTAFELVLFTEATQLRWVHENAGTGVPIVLSEQEQPDAPRAPFRSAAQRGSAMLWGQVNLQASDDLWLSTEDARVGAIAVPFDCRSAPPIPDGARLRLEHVEYLQEDDQGNVSVVDVRYTRISVVEG